MAGNRARASWVSEIDVSAVFCPLSNKHAAEPFEVANQLSPLHSYLDFFDHHLGPRELREVQWLLDQTNSVDEIFPGLLQGFSLCQGTRNIIRPGHPPLTVLHELCSDLQFVLLLSYFVGPLPALYAAADHPQNKKHSAGSKLPAKITGRFSA